MVATHLLIISYQSTNQITQLSYRCNHLPPYGLLVSLGSSWGVEPWRHINGTKKSLKKNIPVIERLSFLLFFKKASSTFHFQILFWKIQMPIQKIYFQIMCGGTEQPHTRKRNVSRMLDTFSYTCSIVSTKFSEAANFPGKNCQKFL